MGERSRLMRAHRLQQYSKRVPCLCMCPGFRLGGGVCYDSLQSPAPVTATACALWSQPVPQLFTPPPQSQQGGGKMSRLSSPACVKGYVGSAITVSARLCLPSLSALANAPTLANESHIKYKHFANCYFFTGCWGKQEQCEPFRWGLCFP